jgi:hypothetical protein
LRSDPSFFPRSIPSDAAAGREIGAEIAALAAHGSDLHYRDARIH